MWADEPDEAQDNREPEPEEPEEPEPEEPAEPEARQLPNQDYRLNQHVREQQEFENQEKGFNYRESPFL